MPLAIDPNEMFDLVLDGDKAKPESARAKFSFRYMSYRQFREASRIADEREKLVGAGAENADYVARSEQSAAKIFAALKRQIAGWRALSIPFSAEKLEDVLTLSEALELFYGSMRQSRISVAEKNASAPPSASSSDKSAKATVPPAGGTAKTPPAL